MEQNRTNFLGLFGFFSLLIFFLFLFFWFFCLFLFIALLIISYFYATGVIASNAMFVHPSIIQRYLLKYLILSVVNIVQEYFKDVFDLDQKYQRRRNLSFVTFPFLKISSINFSHSYCVGITYHGFGTHLNFHGADLSNSNFSYCVLQDCIFCDADLTNADFTGAVLIRCDFSRAQTRGLTWNRQESTLALHKMELEWEASTEEIHAYT